MVSDEPHDPYDRPPLSKQAQLGWFTSADTTLPRRMEIRATWRMGVAATGLDIDRNRVRLTDGQELESIAC